jgi:hypothetical protein
MNEVSYLHNKAMDLAESALLERLRGNKDAEIALSRQALEFELAAIEKLVDPIEPTFSVLHRSAGTLALRCEQFQLAEQIAFKALAKEPPHEIGEELRDLVEQVQFQRHLDLRGVELGQQEVQMSLAGREVGFGMVTAGELIGRIQDAAQLIGRIVERQRNSSFLESGLRKSTRENFPVLVSVPRGASFAVTLKVGNPTGQLRFPTEAQEVVDEFMDLMESVDSSEFHQLKRLIPEPSYLRNFLGLARRIAPDGNRVRQVGFTVMRRGGVPRYVAMTKKAVEIPPPSIIDAGTQDDIPGKPVEVRGMLRFADATSDDENLIKVIDENGIRRSVRVPVGMMNDIVRPMWDSRVIVRGLRKHRAIVMQDIELDESTDVHEEMG